MVYDAHKKMRSCCIVSNSSPISVQKHLKNIRIEGLYLYFIYLISAIILKSEANSRVSFFCLLCIGSRNLRRTGFEELWHHEILTSVPARKTAVHMSRHDCGGKKVS